tara:strand:- start:5574 stop:6278 length:705 start_codon:yes stop_codon:yes gene_type:complete
MSLSVLNNYLEELQETDIELLKNYTSLIQTLLNHIHTNITIKNMGYLKYIIIYGIESITHIYKFLLLYTKNEPLTNHHCEKSILFYVEFITQIGDDNHSFLQLTSKDAVMFLYKKTLFELDETYVKECIHTKTHMNKIKNFHVLSKIIIGMLKHNIQYFTNMDTLMNDIISVNKLVISNIDIILKHPNEFIDIIDMLIPYTDSSITSLNNIMKIYHKNNDMNVLEMFHTITNIL